MGANSSVTILDLLEGYFGELPTKETILKMDLGSLEDLQDRVLEYANAASSADTAGPLDYLGGWFAGSWHYQIFTGDLSLSLLYYPALLVHDPLADFFFADLGALPKFRPLRAANGGMVVSAGPELYANSANFDSMKHDLDSARGYLALLVDGIVDMEPAPIRRRGGQATVASDTATVSSLDGLRTPRRARRPHVRGSPSCC